MDSDSVVRSSQGLKSSDGEDRISELPDFIIGHILSHVPIEDAIRTCVLSKRWISLWKFVTRILFQDTKCYTFPAMRNPRFENLVNGVMLHLNNLSMESFSLFVNHKYPLLDEWIYAALSRRVKKLSVYSRVIRFPADSVYQVPFWFSLEIFQSLEELLLAMVDVHYFYFNCIPETVCFSYLTVLKLYQILLLVGCDHDLESSNDSRNLTLNLPVLRELEATNCTWGGVDRVTLEAPLLEVVSNFSIHHQVSEQFKIQLCVLHLKKFRYFGTVLQLPYSFDISAANIASADIRMFHETDGEEVANYACMLVEQFACKVECLRVQWSQVVKLADDSFVGQSEFKVLSRLVLDSVTIEILLGILLKAPMLKTLMFMEIFQFDKDLLNSAMVPDCFRSSLQEVTFLYTDGSEHELSFAKFVIENARVLQRIILHPNRLVRYTELGKKKLKVATKKLFSFKKACNSAEIVEFLDWA